MNIQESIQAAAQKKQEEQVEKFIDYYSAIIAKSYEQAKSYTNLILAVGYGVFFGLWSTMRGNLRSPSYDLAGFLLGFSVICFILWEVFQMIVTALHEHNVYRKMNKITPKNLEAVDANIKKDFRRFESRVASFWIFQLVLTLVPGLIAVWIFLYKYTEYLVNIP